MDPLDVSLRDLESNEKDLDFLLSSPSVSFLIFSVNLTPSRNTQSRMRSTPDDVVPGLARRRRSSRIGQGPTHPSTVHPLTLPK